MYLAGVSVRRVDDITEALWGTRVSHGTVSNLNKKIYVKIEEWRNRPIECDHPCLYLDGIVMKRTWAGEVRNVSLLVASAVNSEGYREILGICEGAKEDKSGWAAFLRHLVDRGLRGLQLIISDACGGPWSKASLTTCPTPAGSAAWCISTAMCSAMYRRRRCGRSAIWTLGARRAIPFTHPPRTLEDNNLRRRAQTIRHDRTNGAGWRYAWGSVSGLC